MTTAPNPVRTVRDLLAHRLRLGAPQGAAGLTLLPVYGTASGPDYLTAAQGFDRGTLSIGELGGGQVPQLVVHNAGDLPVLLLDGEHLQGARQDRVLNVSVLAAARHDTVIPVSCVEHGRWAYRGTAAGFEPAQDLAYADLRAMQARQGRGPRTDQAQVWADVERKRAQIGGRVSRTAAMRDAYDDRRTDLERIRAAFPGPVDGQAGVLAVAGGRVLALDLFDRDSTLASIWDRLVRGYAVDALDVAQPPDRDADVVAARALVTAIGAQENEATSHEGVGLGIDVVITSPTTVTNALVWEDATVHLAAFPTVSADPRTGRPGASRIDRPGRRAQARTQRREWFHAEGGQA
jgi:hypothetical protein